MKKIKILRYNDLGDLMYLTHGHHLNGVVVDDAALEVMLRIEKTMQRLEVMGDDEQRWLWIELKAPGKRNRWEEADENVIVGKRPMRMAITGIKCLRLTMKASTT